TRAARDLGLSVPDDLLVAVALDGSLARASRPTLTAVDIAPALQASMAVELLLARIEGRPATPPPPVLPQLLPRESTSRPR
ncbi:MAG: substrate-binding domain-containing protein, partial [Patulibacter sp.]|nr:substrate-binding domain-containing protein [Patulibacter sp.]